MTAAALSQPRVIATDRSGAVSGAKPSIGLEEAAEGELVGLEYGRSRSGVADHLLPSVGWPHLLRTDAPLFKASGTEYATVSEWR